MDNCSDLCNQDISSCVSSCNNNTTTKINCGCNPCTTSPIPINPDDTISLVPVLSYNLINCATITKRDSSINQPVTFNVTSDLSNYNNDEFVCINSFYITYDFIGLESILLNNLETYIDGEMFTLTPSNLFNAGSAESPAFLFDSLSGNINLINKCCNDDSIPSRLIRIFQSGRFFEIANLKIFVCGYIGNSPFTAEGIISDNTNQNSTLLRLTSLGLTSSNNFDLSLCFTDTKPPIRIAESFYPNLYVDCIRPGTNYIAPSDTSLQGTFIGLVDFSFCVRKDVSLSKRRSTPLLCDISANSICTNNTLERCDSNG